MVLQIQSLYYLHLKIYLLSSWVRNIAVIPLDIHVICKYTLLNVLPTLKKGTTPFFVVFWDIFFVVFFFEGIGDRSGPFDIQRPVRSTLCDTTHKEKFYNKMAHQFFFCIVCLFVCFLHEHLSKRHWGFRHFSYTPCGCATSWTHQGLARMGGVWNFVPSAQILRLETSAYWHPTNMTPVAPPPQTYRRCI